MKRVIWEVAAAAGVLLVLSYFHSQVNRLDRTANLKEDELGRLSQDLTLARIQLGDREAEQARFDQLARRSDAQGKLLESLRERLATQDRDLGSLQEFLQRWQTQKNEETEDLKRLQEFEGIWSRAAREASHVAVRLKNQEEALARLQGSLLADRADLQKTLLAPSVQLNGPDTVGSGTLIYSGPAREGGGFETYLFTSYHVVRNIFADIPGTRERTVEVSLFSPQGIRQVKADMVAREETLDLALLRLRSREHFLGTAALATPEEMAEVGVFTRIVAVGCPLGHEPIPTQGEVTHLKSRVGEADYWMINAPTYLGNSGGGVFLASSRRLIGVFSKIYTHGKLNPNVIPHMGLCTPLNEVIRWLRSTPYRFLLEPPVEPVHTLAACRKSEATEPGRDRDL